MSNTRDYKAPGQFAADAVTVIPGTPTTGVAYRDTTTTEQDSENGWPFATLVDSATFNQIMFQLTGLARIQDTQGVLGWSNLVDYPVGALVMGSNMQLYRAKTANGPTSSVADPVSATAVWEAYGAAAASGAEVQAGTVANKYVSPATLKQSLGGGLMAANGFMQFQVLVAGAPVTGLIQWVQGSTGGLNAVSSGAWPIAFTNACFLAVLTQMDSYGGQIETMAVLQNYSTTGFNVVNRAVGDTAVGAQGVAFRIIAIGW